MKSVDFFVKGLFRNMPETQLLKDQKEELAAHIVDHMTDLMRDGAGEEEAFRKAVDSLGDLDELIEVLSGRKVKIPGNKVSLMVHSFMLAYGTLYIAAIVLYSFLSDWRLGLSLALPGWVGFSVPFFWTLGRYLRNPKYTEVVDADPRAATRRAFLGWLIISLASGAGNLLSLFIVPGDSSFWAWMPIAGVFSWPFMEALRARFVRGYLPTADGEDRGGRD